MHDQKHKNQGGRDCSFYKHLIALLSLRLYIAINDDGKIIRDFAWQREHIYKADYLKTIKLLMPFILLMTASRTESFFISWGSKVVAKTIKKGLMQCPLCACPTPYELKKIQNYFTMYWVPLFSSGEPIIYLECQQCKTAFNPLYFGLNNDDNEPVNDDQQVINKEALIILAAIGLVAIGSFAYAVCNS